MRHFTLLLVLFFSGGLAPAAGQTPPPAPPARPPAVVARATLIIQVADSSGAFLPSVGVLATGPVEREGVTGADGSLRLVNLRSGSYRLRFSREGFIALERDVLVRAGQPTTAEVMLNAAPTPPPPPPAVEPAPAPPSPVVPVGEAKTIPIPDFVEKNFVGRATKKESPLACLGSGSATLLQLREPFAAHAHDGPDEWVYVVAGEGTLRIAEQDVALSAGTLSVVPRTRDHSFTPRGRNPLIILSILSGEPCLTASAAAAPAR